MPLVYKNRPFKQTRAMLNLEKGWPDISVVSDPVIRALNDLLGKSAAPTTKPQATETIQKRQKQAEKFVSAIEGEISRWIKKVVFPLCHRKHAFTHAL
jgi:hypothetical protein